MAGIDKMNMTKKQFYKFCEWFFEHYSINEEGKEIMEQMNYQNVMDYAIATFNFSNKVDKYLKKNCKLDFVQKRLKEQYGSSSELFDEVSANIPKWVKEKVDMQAEIIDLRHEIEQLKKRE